MATMRIVLRVDLADDRQKKKALKALSTLYGIDSIDMNTRAQRMTAIGCVDPVDVVCKLRKLWFTVHIVTVEEKKEKKREEEEKKKKEEEEKKKPPPQSTQYFYHRSSATPEKFTLEFLNRITNNFSEELIIGHGRYGAIYKGVRDNGECIAVKKVHLKPGLDEEEFQNEFNKLMRTQHQNTIQLVGYCHHIAQVPVDHNGEHVSARVKNEFYASNTCRDEALTSTFYVYMPPEYISRQQISPKFDVFSLGVIIIQIMAGNESYSKCADIPPEEFIEFVHGFWAKGMPETCSRHTSREVRACIEIALECVRSDRLMRPTITKIVDKLNKIYIADCSSIDQLYRTREFTLEFLEHITETFSTQNIVGRGGYGVIYKGVLDNGEEVAVKKLHQMPLIDNEQFKNEFNNLTRVQHKNIVRLVGYCHNIAQIVVEYKGELVTAKVEQRVLCLEYLQGGSLDNYLSDEACKLDWDTCYKIIKGICEGLHFLHNGSDHPIYHLDLKPANILLDKDMTPKIGDFSLSRLFDSIQTYMTQSQDVIGTRGYMPPEYIDRQKISQKLYLVWVS